MLSSVLRRLPWILLVCGAGLIASCGRIGFDLVPADLATDTYPSDCPRVELILSVVVFSDFEFRCFENEGGENGNRFAATG